MLKSKLALSKKKITILTATALCVILIASSALYLFPDQVAQAAIINPHPGLVGWWRFDEGVGAIASDSSGNGNNGRINGATWFTGKYGQALSFDGISNSVDITGIQQETLSLSTFLTVEAWIYPTAFNPHDSVITQRASENKYNWHLCLDSFGRPYFRVYDGSHYPKAIGSTVLALNTWHILPQCETERT
jgi:hypothetical protein